MRLHLLILNWSVTLLNLDSYIAARIVTILHPARGIFYQNGVTSSRLLDITRWKCLVERLVLGNRLGEVDADLGGVCLSNDVFLRFFFNFDFNLRT